MTITGTSTLTASGNNITLQNPANDFVGNVTATGQNIAISDINALSLIGSVASGDLTISSGGQANLGSGTIAGNFSSTTTNAPIIQTGALTVTGTLTVNAGTNTVTLNQAGNDFQGVVTATGFEHRPDGHQQPDHGDHSLRERTMIAGGALIVSGSAGAGLTTTPQVLGTTSFGATAVTGNLSTTSAGAVTQTGALTVSGTTSINAAANAITLTAAANNFTGAVNASNTGANPISITNAGGILLGTVTTADNLTVNAVGITQNAGGLTVGGASTFNGGAGPVTLTTATNDFTGAVSVSNTYANAAQVTIPMRS